ncbi:MAG: peptidoglycan bridge formation glycyltransferase FemA/FemB family protein [Anaerolineae bacterium]
MTSPLTEPAWDSLIDHQCGHLLQSWAWGQLKSRFGWTPLRLHTDHAAAQVLFKQLPLGYTIAYIPKGPLGNWKDSRQCQALMGQIHVEAKKRRAVFLKIEPDLTQPPAGTPGDDFSRRAVAFLAGCGFAPADTIQPQTSIIINLARSDDELLAAMKQKTRYNIRLAAKKGVTVRQGDAADIATFYALAQVTAGRDGFGIHAPGYYRAALELFGPDRCALLLAEYSGEPLAALIVFRYGAAAYYFYGASSDAHRNLMPAYLLQWEAIRWAKNHGCTSYDLWGIPNADEATLEAEFSSRNDGLWGVYRFKRGFGGQVVRTLGAFDFVYSPWLYRLYRRRRGL